MLLAAHLKTAAWRWRCQSVLCAPPVKIVSVKTACFSLEIIHWNQTFQPSDNLNFTKKSTLQVWKLKPMQKFLKPAFFLMASRGRLYWFQKRSPLYVSLWDNDHTPHLIYYLSKQFPNEFMVSIVSIFVYFYTVWCQVVLGFSVRSSAPPSHP